jgi:hypothetical protein
LTPTDGPIAKKEKKMKKQGKKIGDLQENKERKRTAQII